ncbi:MAG: hypothetical protein P8Y70_02955 [Candidatus Lokiarchaeota archaeon]
MVNKHNKSFFGNKTGLTIQSSSKKEPFIFLRCIKKKPDGNWEKTSKGEGKTIKLTLEEMVMILKVLNKELSSWSTYHSYKELQTQISFKWQDGDQERLWINIGDYSKMLSIAQIEVFRRLLDHILNEKIEFSTISEYQNGLDNTESSDDFTPETESNSNKTIQNPPEKRKLHITEERYPPEPQPSESISQGKIGDESEIMTISATVQRITKKAIFLQFAENSEAWIPKSTMHYIEDKDLEIGQNYTFTVDKWVLKKNKII